MNLDQVLLDQIKQLPHKPGVYLFKDLNRQIIYIGKAKDLRNRVNQYVQRFEIDVKANAILTGAVSVECLETATELEALLLEAQLIQNHQPRFNVLLKEGQPFLYITIAQAGAKSLPTLELVRNKKKQGVYFGPFLEKTHARAVYNFLMKAFRLKICGKKIAGGCLYFHLGICSGSCRDDFDEQAYRDRLGLAQMALQKGKKKFLEYLLGEIEVANKALEFERSRDLYHYIQSFEQVFNALGSKSSAGSPYVKKDVWLLTEDKRELLFFEERDGLLKKREHFYFYPQDEQELLLETIKEYFLSVYRQRQPAHVILTNIDLGDDLELFGQFLQSLHNLDLVPTILCPLNKALRDSSNELPQGEREKLLATYNITAHPEEAGMAVSKDILERSVTSNTHYAQIMKMAQIQAEQDRAKRQTLGIMLKKLFLLSSEPKTIDCFDISHKQGTFMVGACVRFFNGQPEPDKFRRFKIKTVVGQNDYASLREIVERRYKDGIDVPDLILIDGGKGQLHAVEDLLPQAEFASLAKREETVFSKRLSPEGKKLDLQSFSGQVLVALRDYTHHFAISYHRLLAKNATAE